MHNYRMCRKVSKVVHRLGAALLTLAFAANIAAIAASAAQPSGSSHFFLQASTGSLYWLNRNTGEWQHHDSGEFSLGHRFGNWCETELAWLVRTDISTGLLLDTRLRLLRLGPASLRLKATGSIGTGLDGDVYVYRSVAMGPEAELQMSRYTLAAWGIAGFTEKSPWHFNALEAPYAEAGIALRPTSGKSGLTVSGAYTVTESVDPGRQFDGSWSGNVGFRWAL